MKVAVLGNGQLGAMLQEAGLRIGVDVTTLNIDGDTLPDNDTIITAEREHWPTNAFTQAIENHPNWLNKATFAALANRISQKKLLDQLGLATSPWLELNPSISQEAIHQKLGPDVFLKRASGGYDGYGQLRIKQATPTDLSAWQNDVIAEQAINFDGEVSIIGARNRQGETVFYRLTENRHTNGILIISLSQPARHAQLQAQAEQMLSTVMNALDYVGVMAMECFMVGGKLMVNEIAPRVHNSAHWTQAGASISQFELHLRAVCGLHLAQPVQTGSSMMVNLIGVPYNPDWLKHGAARLHWYGKDWRAGRKMGHLNFHHPDPAQLRQWLTELELPEQFQSAKEWALNNLGATA
ncbi:5-(carboxyamino)imidazole ribonucleotide synthase [Sapientia aquatica]|uniref:N5-carboxyaminoimidazole ribonucleotide synthase n=1 Tax=Sapientia aquatica TaxID=1549640 RepID=A0A4R5W3E7_9BURK|nr:5-(carboxyamino)imidazole ribonucleotide synthase [Sapientia aquatica]TDK66557.1 5-(carboxyamino)imidazole ribonucleotide synthase [Sapientia aquatica]